MGLRFHHLWELLRNGYQDSGNPLLDVLDQFFTTAAAGAVPPPVMEALCGARLFPLCKKDAAVRIVAVADTLRRRVGKTLLQPPAGH